MNVIHKPGLTYRDLTNGKLEKYSEALLQQMILNPMIREISKAASIIPEIKQVIKTHFLVQDEIEIVPGQPGQKPAVDALIQITKADDTVIACVPIETKVDMNIRHYSQIACYINKLSTVEELTKFVMIGAIIDKRQFRLAFSVYRNGEIPLPIVHISPPIEWRSEFSSMIDQTAILTLACTFLTGQHERLQYSKKDCHGISTDKLTELGQLLQKNPHELGKPTKQSMHFLSLQIKQKALEEKVTEQDKKINELLEILDDKKRKRPQNIIITSPTVIAVCVNTKN